MGSEASCRMAGLATAIVLAVTGCNGASAPPRDASSARVQAEGAAESQPADTAPPQAETAGATAGDSSTYGSDPGRDPHVMRRVLGWVSLSIGIEAAALAGVTSALIEHQKGVRDDNCNAQKVCNAAGFAAVNTIDSIVPWNTASWFVAAAGLGVGAVLVITSPRESTRRTAITLSPNSSGLALGLRSTF
jgi:hypothetical protein